MADENVAPLHIKFSRRASKTTLAGGAMMLLFAIVGLLVSFGGPGPATVATVVSAIGLLACAVVAIADLLRHAASASPRASRVGTGPGSAYET
jgi:hypothetical protein